MIHTPSYNEEINQGSKRIDKPIFKKMTAIDLLEEDEEDDDEYFSSSLAVKTVNKNQKEYTVSID